MLVSAPASAKWAAELATSGFMGTLSAGPVYEWAGRHHVAMTIGAYQNGENRYGQLNTAYRYARWRFERPDILWKPLHIGLFTLYSLDQKRFFVKSPSRYPEDGYYEQTALRGGLEIGTTILFVKSKIGLASYLRVLDNGVIALLNNVHRDLQYYSSSGVALQYQF